MPFLTYSSIDRTIGIDSDFTDFSSQTIAGFSKVRLHQIVFMNSMYNITTNNFLSYKESVNPSGIPFIQRVVTLEPGNYSKDAIIQEFLDQGVILTNNNDGANAGKFIFSLVNGNYFSIDASLTGLNTILGFSRSSDSQFLDEFVSPRLYNLSRYTNLYLLTNIIASQGFLSAGNQRASLLGSIPIDKVFGELIAFENIQTDRFHQIQNTNINSVSFRLVDQEGTSIDLNGLFMTITLEVF